MGSSECREVPVEAAETLRDGPQCLILPYEPFPDAYSVGDRFRVAYT